MWGRVIDHGGNRETTDAPAVQVWDDYREWLATKQFKRLSPKPEDLPIENLWRLHFSAEGGAAHNVSSEFVASPGIPEEANYLELTAGPDGNFEASNSRTRSAKRYTTHSIQARQALNCAPRLTEYS